MFELFWPLLTLFLIYLRTAVPKDMTMDCTNRFTTAYSLPAFVRRAYLLGFPDVVSVSLAATCRTAKADMFLTCGN